MTMNKTKTEHILRILQDALEVVQNVDLNADITAKAETQPAYAVGYSRSALQNAIKELQSMPTK